MFRRFLKGYPEWGMEVNVKNKHMHKKKNNKIKMYNSIKQEHIQNTNTLDTRNTEQRRSKEGELEKNFI